MRPIGHSLMRKQFETIKMSVTWSTTMVTNMSIFRTIRFPRRRSKLRGWQLRGSQYTTSITNLKRLLAAKFFSSSTWWRSGRCLVTKPYSVNTQQFLQERDELDQKLCLRSQFAWTEFTQCLCNFYTVWRLVKQSFYMSRVRRKEGP